MLDRLIGVEEALWKWLVSAYWMQIQTFAQYAPTGLDPSIGGKGPLCAAGSTKFLGVTPSLNQGLYLYSAVRSVLEQGIPSLRYFVADGGSNDDSVAILQNLSSPELAWDSFPDDGQAGAIARGFQQISESDGDTVMFWLNADDMLLPGALAFVASFFRQHPAVDVLYGHRIIIDQEGWEIGRWILPRHHPAALHWVDYIPQETLFWRKRAWDRVGGLSQRFHFAMDWDLLLRFQQAGLRIVRVPYFLASFRYHPGQKTFFHVKSRERGRRDRGEIEIERIRSRENGCAYDARYITHYGLKTKILGSLYSRLLELGIRI